MVCSLMWIVEYNYGKKDRLMIKSTILFDQMLYNIFVPERKIQTIWP